MGMKFIVDEMPKSKSKCYFSEWKPYPPIMEETGHYICKIDHNDCNLCETECKLLKQEAVVRCKDCKKRYTVLCIQEEVGNINNQDDWFCADGERYK